MSRMPSSSRRRHSVPQEPTNSAQKVSFGTSYRPSRRTEVSYETMDGATASETSVMALLQHPDPNEGLVRRADQGAQVIAPLQHTHPNDGSVRRADQGATSKKIGSNKSGRKNVWRSLNYPHATSRTEDSAIIISRLRREILDLKQGGRSQSTAKERPRNRSEPRSLTLQPNPKQSPESGGHSRTRPPLHVGNGQQTKEHASKKTARPGGQHVVWRALDLVLSSPFSRQIERAKLPERYTAPRFKIYDGRSDPVAHIGRYQQTRQKNNQLMDRNGQGVCGAFISNSRKTKEMDALLTMKLQSNETIKEYSIRFWETYNDIDRCDEKVAVRTFKLGLPPDTGLRQSLTKRPSPTVMKLMHKIDQFIRAFETVFKELIYKLIEKIKREPFFVWPSKLIGNPDLRDAKLYCNYHKDTGHMTENCHKLKVHLEHLATARHLDQYIDTKLTKKKGPSITTQQLNSSGTIAAGVIHVIHDPLCSIVSTSGGGMEQVISFSDSDLKDVQLPHNDPLVVTLRIGNYDVERVLIDQGSFAEVMYQDLYAKLGMGEAELSSFASPIFGFSGEPVVPLGKAVLPVLAGPVILQMEFIVVKASLPYNAIIGRDWLHRMRAIPSTLHQKLRFPMKDWIMELSGDQSQEPEDGEVVMTEQPEKVFFDPFNPEQFFLVDSKLSAVDREQLLQVLISNRDVFASLVYDAPGVSLELACHSLNIGFEHRPIYPMWLSNTVVVKKKNGKWRVCIDFTDLNKACPKDPFPLPRIDQLVDSASGHAQLSFLDAFQGYHQIPMNDADQDKTTFITPKGTYCYKMMPFGLKNAGATYERMVTKMFRHMRGKTVEVYIDDMLVKSKFLGHIVSRRGIEPNPDQIAALVDSAEPRNIKQVQRLTSMVAALGRFISRSADKCKSFFRLLGKMSKFLWKEECSVTFQGIKTYLSTPPCLSIPNQGESLFLYLAVSDHAGVYLGSLGVEYKPRTAIKGQVLAEFLAEFQYDRKSPPSIILAEAQLDLVTERWELFVDGASNSKGSGAGVVLVSPEGLVLKQAVRLKFLASNNEAEYEALLIGLRTAKRLGACHLQNFLFEIHEGICGSHTGGRSLAHRAISQGYWWPYMQTDALKYVRECDKCQRFAPMIHQPARELNPLSSPWPFAQWGLDIVGPLPRAPRNKKFLITATDYFTKWIEAEPLSNIRDVDTKRFFWKNVITRFGIPWAAISDNGTQFESRLFKGFCSDLGIKNFFSSPGYPQSNRQAEASNKIILNGIKRKLEEAKGKWVEELPSVLWTHRTMGRKSTDETPFALGYGVEAVIPLEVGIRTTRTIDFAVETNKDNLRKDLDFSEERQDLAPVRLASYQQQIKREHDRNINHRVFRIGDLVLRKVMANTRRPNEGKLGPNWEGPYKVVSLAGAGSYRLEDLEGKPIPRP
uniref:Integrase catalytic domain-containing protein n=1 Tax=Fagus sylvatica TaxID=28930 RepID=A0A2N9GA36_FAGSY